MVKSQTRMVLFCGLAMLGALVPSVSLSGPIFEEKGTLTVGALVQQGMLVGDAAPTDEFDTGTGYGMRLRYYLGSSRAFGISFENQVFDAKPSSLSADQPKEFRAAVVTLDYLWYFDRKSTLSRYATVGLGVHHPVSEYKLDSKPGRDGIVGCIGGGLEYFFHRSTSIDISVKGYGLLGQGGFLGSVEVAGGISFYIID